MKKAIVLFSGGLDSTVLAYKLRSEGYEVGLLSVDYEQRHAVELASGARTAELEAFDRRTVVLKDARSIFGRNALTDMSVPVPPGDGTPEERVDIVVPNRNMVMFSLGLAWAISDKAEVVAYGANVTDMQVCPDSRPEFVHAMQVVADTWTPHRVDIQAPFVTWTKAQIVECGAKLGVDFADTWSCSEGLGKEHCGKCADCLQRKEAFLVACVDDPTPYRQ